jgi:carboxyl-terminal processing protease
LDKLMPPAEEMIPPLPSTRDSVLSVLQPQRPTPIPEKYSPVMEVWTLVNKYYIDRSFGGQDWDAVRQKYVAQEQQPGSEDDGDPMRLASEMIQSLGDRYSRVLNARQYAAIQKFDLIGVGVTLMPNERRQIVVGAPPIPGSASQRAGMKLGDIILSVNGVKTEGRSAFDIIDQISEHPNDKTIRMMVQDAEEGTTEELTMERNVLLVSNPIQYKVSEIRKDGTKVGFIRVLEFNSLVKAKLEEAFEELQKQGCNAFVMDLRGNPGGAFQSAVEISSLFVDNRVATTVVDSSGVRLAFRTATGQVVVDPRAPLAIWIDGGSASASEVLAGSLHDNCRAVVMGDQSFGKGLIQAVYGLKNGAGLVLTVARYVTPNGTEIQGLGVTPDIKGNVPFYFPGFSTDTSRVDFPDITRRLDPTVCKVPNQR